MSFIGGSSVNVTIDLSNVPNELPSQTGQAGKALVTNGSSVSWASAGTSLPTDGSTSVAYTTTNTTAGRKYGFNLESNTCGIVEHPYIITSDNTGDRGVHVGYGHEHSAYGGGSVSLGYEALYPTPGVTTTTSHTERTVAIGYQAGYHAETTGSSIFIGPWQGYDVSMGLQLRIGNSGTPHPNTGFDKALLEGTFGLTDATQTLKINADNVFLGSTLPTTQPSDARLWLNNGSLSIGAAGGSPTQVDPQALANDTARLGITFGERIYNWVFEDHLFTIADKEITKCFNGYRNHTSGVAGDHGAPDKARIGGHFDITPINGTHYKFRGMTWFSNNYSGGTSSSNNLSLYSAGDVRWAAFGLKDGAWKWLGTCSWNNANNAQGWNSTPWTNTSETDPTNITANIYSAPWEPNPRSLIPTSNNNPPYGNGFFWNFTHNVDFYQSYRVKMVYTQSHTHVNYVYYVNIGQGGIWEIDFY